MKSRLKTTRCNSIVIYLFLVSVGDFPKRQWKQGLFGASLSPQLSDLSFVWEKREGRKITVTTLLSQATCVPSSASWPNSQQTIMAAVIDLKLPVSPLVKTHYLNDKTAATCQQLSNDAVCLLHLHCFK